MTESVIISPFLALPVCGLVMVVVAIHMEHTIESMAPRSRRRLRVANGWVMLMGLPLLASGSSLINPDTHPRLFALVWSGAIIFLTLALVIAMGDVLNTMRLTSRRRAQIRESFHSDLLEQLLRSKHQPEHSADISTKEPNDPASN